MTSDSGMRATTTSTHGLECRGDRFDARGEVFDTAGIIVRAGWYSVTPLRPVVYSAEKLCVPDGMRAGLYTAIGAVTPCNSRQPFASGD